MEALSRNDSKVSFSNRLFAMFGILGLSLLITGCQTNPTVAQNDNSVTVTNPSERVAIKQQHTSPNKSRNDLPPEVVAFLEKGVVDEEQNKKVTPTRVGRGSYNHAILNNAKATDVVALDHSKQLPPMALPYYGTEDILKAPVDYVAQAPAYFMATSQSYQVSAPSSVIRTKSFASVKVNNKRTKTVPIAKSTSKARNAKVSAPVAKTRVKAQVSAKTAKKR